MTTHVGPSNIDSVPRFSRRGLSLVEVLVVVVIMAILLALLLPAVQRARETTRRAACLNNLAQVGKAILSFESAYDRFPPGGGNDLPPFGNCGNVARNGRLFGSSWIIYTMPYMEQDFYKNWSWSCGSTMYCLNPNSWTTVGPVPILRCPSSPLNVYSGYQPGLYAYGWNCVTGAIRYTSSYYAINGSSRDFPGFTETRRQGPGTDGNGCCDTGWVAGGGILAPLGQVRMANVRDGVNNTLLVAEVSDYYLNSRTRRRDIDWNWDGLINGTDSPLPPNLATGSFYGRSFNATSILFPVNHGPWDGNACGGWGCCTTGACGWRTGGNPLSSPHPGGVMALMGGGNVRFLGDDTNLDTLSALAVRDDGVEVAPAD